MSRRQINHRLAMPVPCKTRMLLNNRPRARNPASRSLPRNHSRKIRRTPAGRQALAKPAGEARAPGKLQNHLEAAALPRDPRQLRRQIPRLLRRQDPRREPPRHLKLPLRQDNAATRSSKEARQVVSGEIEHWTPTLKPVSLS